MDDPSPPTKRPDWFSLRRPVRLGSLVFLAISVGYYLYSCALYYGRHTNIAHNYAAELDAKAAAAVPGGKLDDTNRAWPVLKQLQRKINTIDFKGRDWPNPQPGTPDWNAALAVLAQHPGVIEELRAACQRPAMGYYLSGKENPDDPTDTGTAGTSELPLVAALMPYLGCARNQARWLMFDAAVAVHEHDASRAAADFQAALSLSRLSSEHGPMLGQLVRIAITAMAINRLLDVLAAEPGFFSDSQLSDLSARIIDAIGPDAQIISLDHERLNQLDHAQRIFTDDGQGDGHFCADGQQYLEAMSGHSPTGIDLILTRLTAPTLVERFGTRRQYIETFDRLASPFLPQNRKPLWQCPIVNPAVIAAERIADNKGIRPAQRLPALLISAFGKAVDAAEHQIQLRDAVIVSIALERYRQANSTFPDSLQELVPRFLTAIPVDRLDGKPLKYLVKVGHPTLYSIGADVTDDQGAPMRDADGKIVRFHLNRESPLKGDWVFFPPPSDPPQTGDKAP